MGFDQLLSRYLDKPIISTILIMLSCLAQDLLYTDAKKALSERRKS
jgi:hypothetical protein